MLTCSIDSSLLSQCFAQQGIKISIRKGRRIRGIKPFRSKADNDDTNEDSKRNKKMSQKEEEEPEPKENANGKPSYRRIHISSFLSPS